jgi:hypothetical protein
VTAVTNLNPGEKQIVQDDINHLLSRLRPRDRTELIECGFDHASACEVFAMPAVLARVFHHGGAPAAIIAFHALTPRALNVSLLASPDWPKVARAAWRWGTREARPHLLHIGFRRAECRTMEGHADAVRFLERLGFRRECLIRNFGASGAAFIQYAWRSEDHVSRPYTQGAAGAATARAA